MKHLNIYIAEDEPIIVATIETILLKMGHTICGEADSVVDIKQDLTKIKPDLVLVDINLEGNEDGIDLAKHLDLKSIPYIFLTSQTDPETIARVKTTSPLGYVVKPFTEASLQSNIEIAWHTYQSTEKEYLLIKSNGRLHKVDQSTIKYLKAFDNYCYIFTTSTSYLVPHTLKHISGKLNSDFFIKSHRSYLINIRMVTGISSDSVLIDKEEIPLSTKNKELFTLKLTNW
ncbi:LytR/AlgR family response regulator transcription factor [Cochleicola gelatinilyticus]|uniref:LytTR family transcriptional regulator n=1 Tax=Cochleicola gelatinilyticus TaxID=1763537 RepID=A0A167JBF2_9FLAO|nr:response regulator [Cochleicola gelatinilyticus]OAB80514.1 hypothetical protein ULVI_07210 [Cochleicola gelatinilyticus]